MEPEIGSSASIFTQSFPGIRMSSRRSIAACMNGAAYRGDSMIPAESRVSGKTCAM